MRAVTTVYPCILFYVLQPTVTDVSVTDVSVTDVSVTDVSVTDVSVTDASVTDVSVTDVSVKDVSVTDVSVTDVSVISQYTALVHYWMHHSSYNASGRHCDSLRLYYVHITVN